MSVTITIVVICRATVIIRCTTVTVATAFVIIKHVLLWPLHQCALPDQARLPLICCCWLLLY
jgi:hypothetical protein